MRRYRFVCRLNIGDVLLQTLVWVALVVVTLGIAALFFAYYLGRLIINRTEVVEISAEAGAL